MSAPMSAPNTSTATQSLVNPYDLLGVTIHSSKKDVRKAYYALASMCHPDRGGTKEQMHTVHQAYVYVLQQIEMNKDTSYEDLERDFKDFCATQLIEAPPFVDIHSMVFHTTKFNEYFEAQQKPKEHDGAFEDGGYEIENSEFVQCQTCPEYVPFTGPSRMPEYSRDVIIYTEPCPVLPAGGEFTRLLHKPKLKDFTCTVGSSTASDYRVAYSAAEIPSPIAGYDDTCSVDSRYQNLLQIRERESMFQPRQDDLQAPDFKYQAEHMYRGYATHMS